MFRALKSFCRIPLVEKKTVMEVVLLLLFGRILLLLPYKYMKHFLGVYNKAGEESTADIREIRKISVYIRRIGNRLPWECTCLVNALAAKIMLRKRGVPATVYFGMARGEKKELIAHAWVKSGDFLVTGKDEGHEYKTVGHFS
jgi:hypothetical protein